MYNWTTSIRHIKGMGPARAKELEDIGIKTVGDLLEYQPLHYIYPGITSIKDTKEGYVIIRATVVSLNRLPTLTPIVEAKLRDETGECVVRWYGQHHGLAYISPGMTIVLWGKLTHGILQQPNFTTTAQPIWDNITGGYYGVHNITIRMALKEILPNLRLPPTYNDLDRATVFDIFHFPECENAQKGALTCLKFDEALCHQFALAERKKERYAQPSCQMSYDREFDQKIRGFFPYTLTEEQGSAVDNIIEDMSYSYPMARLLYGEVGSGKTAVMFYAAMLAALNNKRTLILCPTTILAQQHYDVLKSLGWDDIGLCLGNENFADTKVASIIIGTHAILNSDYLLQTASLVIFDEFHKFGVEQRAQATKHHPHLLLVSATPIPRTLACSVFGDLDVSTIREQPTARGQVITRWVLPDKREAMYEIIERELTKGHQVYVVYPRIGDEEQEQSAIKGFNNIYNQFDGKYHACLLTGKHSGDDKKYALQCFRNGSVKILVSTIIAEVGLDCPNATVMVIEGADRFGLSQLHQLRGRICRATDTAFCFLVAETANLDSIARLEVIERCNNGFEIAEHDLRLRGPGEMLGTKQHGVPEFKFLSLVDDYDIMIKAKGVVNDGLINDGVREMAQLKYGLKPGGLI